MSRRHPTLSFVPPLLAWILAHTCPAQAAVEFQGVEVQGVEADDPFTITASATASELKIAVAMRKGWHLYGKDVGGGETVSVAVAKDSGFAAAGPLRIPETKSGKLTGEFELALPLRRAKAGGALRATLSLMACDPLMCLPPKDVVLVGSGKGVTAPLKVLLVAVGDAERNTRIESFLEKRGFDCTVAALAGLTADQCDSHDLVILDSPNAGQSSSRAAMKSRPDASKFPQTNSPIIAVGYLGTEMLKAHKIAMACGYI